MRYENNINEIINRLNSLADNIGNEIGITETANVQSNTPVDSGTLRRSINYNSSKEDSNIKIEIGVDGSLVNSKNGQLVKYYAMKVEYENTSYLRDTIKGDENLIKEIIISNLRELG